MRSPLVVRTCRKKRVHHVRFPLTPPPPLCLAIIHLTCVSMSNNRARWKEHALECADTWTVTCSIAPNMIAVEQGGRVCILHPYSSVVLVDDIVGELRGRPILNRDSRSVVGGVVNTKKG